MWVHDDGGNALLSAVLSRRIEEVEGALTAGALLAKKDATGRSALSVATELGLGEIVSPLLQHGECTSTGDRKGMSPLHSAALIRSHDVAQTLIDRGAFLYDLDDSGASLLDLAIQRGRTDVFFLLQTTLMKDLDAAKRDTYDYKILTEIAIEALHSAVRSGRKDYLEVAIAWGISLEERNSEGFTPLCVAVVLGFEHIVALLLEHGACPNTTDTQGRSPLHWAALMGSPHVVQILLRNGACLHVENVVGESPIEYATQRGNRAVVSILLNARNCPLCRTKKKNLKKEEIKEKRRKTNPSSKKNDPRCFSSIHNVVKNCPRSIKDAIAAEASLEETDSEGNTPLCVAAEFACKTSVSVLLMHGALPNATNKRGMSVLHCAAIPGSKSIIRELLRNGAWPCSVDRLGRTPYDLAIRHGHRKAANLIKKAVGTWPGVVASTGQETLVNPNDTVPLEKTCTDEQVEKVVRTKPKAPKSTVRKQVQGRVLIGEERHKFVRTGQSRPTTEARKPVHNDTKLCRAVRTGRKELVEELLGNGVSLEEADGEGSTALSTATAAGLIDIVTLLLQHGARCNATNKDGRSPLHQAALAGYEGIARELLRAGASPRIRDAAGDSPLDLARMKSHWRCASAMEQALEKDKVGQRTTTARSANAEKHDGVIRRGPVRGLRSLVNEFEDVGGPTASELFGNAGNCSLHEAVLTDKVNMVRSLLKGKLPLDEKDVEGNTALCVAAANGLHEMVSLLLREGANPHATNDKGQSSLHLAAVSGRMCVVKELISKGVSPLCYDLADKTPLDLAAQNGHQSIVSLLQQTISKNQRQLKNTRNKANPKRSSGIDKLHYSILNREVHRAKKIIEERTSLEFSDKLGNTLLCLAARIGLAGVVSCLLRKGALPNARNDEGRTALHLAAEEGHCAVASTLLKWGAYPCVFDRSGMSPFSIARRTGHGGIAALLKNAVDNLKFHPQHVPRTRQLSQNTVHKKRKLASELLKAAKAREWEEVYFILEGNSFLCVRDESNGRHINSHLYTHAAADESTIPYVMESFVNCTDENGMTALHFATKAGQYNIVELLLSHGADSSSKDKYRQSSLDIAKNMKARDLVELMETTFHWHSPRERVEERKEVQKWLRVIDAAEKRAERWSARRAMERQAVRSANEFEMVTRENWEKREKQEKLHCLRKARSIEKRMPRTSGGHDWSLIRNVELAAVRAAKVSGKHCAKRAANLAMLNTIVRTLLIRQRRSLKDDQLVSCGNKRRATPLQRMPMTALHRAASRGRDNCIKLLLTRGAYVDCVNRSGRTPLHVAVSAGHAGCARVLLRGGADVIRADNEGRTPLHAASWNGQAECVRVLLQHGADHCRREDRYKSSPLHLAALKGWDDCILALVRGNADVTSRDARGQTPLHVAAWNGHSRCVRSLVENGADVESECTRGRTALHLAAMNGKRECISVLLMIGAKIDAIDKNRRSALNLAVSKGHFECVDFLRIALQRKMNVNQGARKGGRGRSPAV